MKRLPAILCSGALAVGGFALAFAFARWRGWIGERDMENYAVVVGEPSYWAGLVASYATDWHLAIVGGGAIACLTALGYKVLRRRETER